jgi:hypothetical protein
MTVTALLPLLVEYRAGLEAELAMLRQLAALSARQREQTVGQRLDDLDQITDARERAMATLVSIESQLHPIRHALVESREQLQSLPEFQQVVALHREAAALAESVVAADGESLAALREAELARRLAADTLEKSESTLAAYRRVVMPDLASATLVNRQG